MVSSYTLNKDVIYRKIGDQRMLVPIGQHIADVRFIYTLNETAAFVLDSLQANMTTDQVINKLIEEYDCADLSVAQKAVENVIEEFKQHNIIL